MIYFLVHCKQIYDKFVRDEITVYAAQASFFIVLSSVPFIILLLTVLQFVPAVQQSDLLYLLSRLLPIEVQPLVYTIIGEIYFKSSAALLSVSSIVTLWSAARGMQGIERGLNRIIGCPKRRGYVISRLINSGYTIVFMAVCAMSLALLVFGTVLQNLALRFLPFLRFLSPYLISLRSILSLIILAVFFTGLYTFLPYEKMRLKSQLPGAVFSTVCWILFSFAFSLYFKYFSRFSTMYGSLASVAVLMLWLYFCICILFMGAEINFHLSRMEHFRKNRHS